MKPGKMTTEFWVTLAGMAAGVALILTGHEQHGSQLLKWSVVGYGGSRAVAKSGIGEVVGAVLKGRRE